MWPCWIRLPSVLAPILREERPGGFVQVQQLAHIHQKLKGEAVNRKKRTNSTSQLKQFSGGGQTSNRNNSLLLFYITAKKKWIYTLCQKYLILHTYPRREKKNGHKQAAFGWQVFIHELWTVKDARHAYLLLIHCWQRKEGLTPESFFLSLLNK